MKRANSLLLVLAIVAGGCAPVLVAGLIAHSSSTKNQKKEFIANFERNNTEREKAGLVPQDFCSEAFRFDPGWAASLPECSRRVRRYEAGDTTALFVRQPTPAVAAVPAITSDSALSKAPIAIQPAPTTNTAAASGAYPVIPGAPFTVVLADGTLLPASAITPSSTGDLKVTLTIGLDRYVGENKVKLILNEAGDDLTSTVLKDRKSLPR